MPLALDHIVLNARDLEAMLAFYTGTLGLEPERVHLYREGRVPFPSVRVNESTIIDLLPEALWSAGETGESENAQNLNHFCLAMDPAHWKSLLEKLAAAGVSIDSGPMTLYGARGDGEAVYVSDPDGNRLELRYYGSAVGPR